jgi:hypothetical protein
MAPPIFKKEDPEAPLPRRERNDNDAAAGPESQTGPMASVQPNIHSFEDPGVDDIHTDQHRGDRELGDT